MYKCFHLQDWYGWFNNNNNNNNNNNKEDF